MTVFRVNKTKDYVTMSKVHLKDKNMSLKAKGLLSQMLGLPDEWDYSINGLVAINKENESAIKSTLSELKEFGYLKVTKLLPNITTSGRIEYIYDIYEKPIQEGKKQEVENLPLEIQQVENPTQLNNKELITKELNDKEYKENNKRKYFDDEELNDLFIEYLNLRKKIKAVNSERAIKLLLSKLEGYPDSIKKEMIEEAIVNSWKSVYPLKEEKQTAKDRHDSQLKVLEDIYNGNIKLN
jgi:hypothetical protein